MVQVEFRLSPGGGKRVMSVFSRKTEEVRLTWIKKMENSSTKAIRVLTMTVRSPLCSNLCLSSSPSEEDESYSYKYEMWVVWLLDII